MPNDPILSVVFSTRDALRAGMSRGQVQRRVTSGHCRRLRPGVFCLASTWETASPEQRHTLLAAGVAAARRDTGTFALSHTTAAVLLNLPSPRAVLSEVHLSVPPRTPGHSRRRRGVCQHVAGLIPDEITEVLQLPVTTPARTVADCSRQLDAIDAVPIIDAAFRSGLATPRRVDDVLARQAGWPRAEVARASLQLADGRRETPLESRSAVVMHRHNLPVPTPQVKIYDHRGRFVARVDFAWLEYGVVGEADGRAKYDADGDPIRSFEAEKERQRRLEALGLVVVRWNARDLVGSTPAMVERLRGALARGNAARFTGRAA